MRKIISVLLTLIISCSLFGNFVSAEEAATEYELWAQTPCFTTSVGQEEFRIQKAMNKGTFLMYPLTQLGNRYYFAIAEAQLANNGKNGRTNISILHCYLLLALDDSYVILDFFTTGSDYYWSRGVNIDYIGDVSSKPSKGSKAMYVIKPNGRYEVSSWENYNDYMIITEEKRMVSISEDNYYGQGGWPMIKSGKIYWANEYYFNGSGTYRYTDSNRRDGTQLKELYFNGNNAEYGTTTVQTATDITTANGYTPYQTVTADVTTCLTSASNWGNLIIDNIFDDGRSIECEWNYVGNYYEMWYYIKDREGKICARGPTGFTVNETNAQNRCFCIAIGNTKFITGVLDVHSNLTREYYRASIVKETADGNVIPGTSLGNKTLTPPASADTVPVQNVIDFGMDNLPIGYNIKNNVIGTSKLDSNVRERINAIRLNDIVIVKNVGTISGTQNVGVSLSAFDFYDNTLGSSSVRVYTNGQNFSWYCSDVNKLNSGTYNKNYTIGDKVIYVTYKIVDAPNNNGVTTVVF